MSSASLHSLSSLDLTVSPSSSLPPPPTTPLSLDCMASMRRGSRVIRCMGSMRKDCMLRDWHTGEDSSSRRASTNLGFFSLQIGKK